MDTSQSGHREAESLFEMVKDRYGGRLTEEQLENVRRSVDTVVDNAETLRSVRLDNAEEPPAVFAPYRKKG